MVGPTGPRRLRLAVERLAQFREGVAIMLTLIKAVKKPIVRKQIDEVERYQKHVIDQTVEIIKHEDIGCMFAAGIESIGERISIPGSGIKVFSVEGQQ